MTEYAYSLDGDEYFEADSVEEAIRLAQLELNYDLDVGDEAGFYVAEIVRPWEYLDADFLGAHVANLVNVELDGRISGDDHPVNLTDWEDCGRLGRLVIDFLKNGGFFEGFGVKNVTDHFYTKEVE
jgi:hypothetical protein